MEEIECCWLCWESLPKNGKSGDEGDNLKLDSRTYLDNCIKYLNLESGNLDELTAELENCPLCLNCLDSAKKLTGIVDELEKIKRDLDEYCSTFLESLKHTRENIRLQNMKSVKKFTKKRKIIKTEEELTSEDNEEVDINLESDVNDCSSEFEDTGLVIEQSDDKEDSSLMLDPELSSNNGEQFKAVTTTTDTDIIPNDPKERSKISTAYSYGKSKRLKYNKSSFSEDNRKTHKKGKGRSIKSKSFNCEACGETFEGRKLLSKHVVKHQTERPYKCSFCPKSFKLNSDLTRHERPHKEGRAYVCNICDKAFNWSKNLNNHRKLVHAVSSEIAVIRKEYQCDECGAVIKKSKASFEDHKRLHTGEKPFKCESCDQHFRTKLNLQVHTIKEHVHDHPFQCDQCEMKFKTKRHLSDHQKTAHARLDEMFVCEDCGKSYKRKADYISHRGVVHDKVKYKCDHCDKLFSRTSERAFHVKLVHTKEIAFVCHFCGEEKTCQRNLNDHVRTHTGEKPFQCKECGKHFTSNRSLYWHHHHGANHRTKK